LLENLKLKLFKTETRNKFKKASQKRNTSKIITEFIVTNFVNLNKFRQVKSQNLTGYNFTAKMCLVILNHLCK